MTKHVPSTSGAGGEALPDLTAVDLVPSGVYVMTAEFEGQRMGMCVRWVQRAGITPPMVSLALLKGHPISPLVRDARAFGLCQLADDDRFLERKFSVEDPMDIDPFASLEVDTLVTGAPLIRRAAAGLDCRVAMHIDCDADHELYIAEVVGARVYARGAKPAIRFEL